MTVPRPARALGLFLAAVLMGGVLIAAGNRPASADSSWSVTSSANVGTGENELRGVSCPSTTSCIAVGDYFFDDSGTFGYRTLIESWDGSDWTVVPSPNADALYNELDAVSCVDASDCVAVGLSGSGLTLIETWDGTNWTVTPSPDVDGVDNYLLGVSCASTSSCVAVGNTDNGTSQQTLIESWDGTSWTISPSITPATLDTLSSVSCASSTNCIAVGYSAEPDAGNQTLVESWDGTSWTVTPSPNVGNGSAFSGVSCTSTTSCRAVGFFDSSSGEAPFVETWDGTSWTVTPSPSVGTGDAGLSGVSCVSDASCVAVGYAAPDQTLVETWDGTSWGVADSPNPGTRYDILFGVSCADEDTCSAVGYYRDFDSDSSAQARGDASSHLPKTLSEIGPAQSTATVAGPPMNATAFPGNGRATIGWTAPANDGGAAVTNYRVSVYDGSGGTATGVTGSISRLVGSAATSSTFRGLSNGTAYRFRVAAVNGAGTGRNSKLSVAMIAGSPAPPTDVVATAGSGTATTGPLVVSFTAGAKNGSPITGYTARCTSSDGGVNRAKSAAASPITVPHLTTARTYTCIVKATNARGTSNASAPSAPVVVS